MYSILEATTEKQYNTVIRRCGFCSTTTSLFLVSSSTDGHFMSGKGSRCLQRATLCSVFRSLGVSCPTVDSTARRTARIEDQAASNEYYCVIKWLAKRRDFGVPA